MSRTVVVNRYKKPYDVWCGRGRGGCVPAPPEFGCFGNPFPVGPLVSLENSLAMFEGYFLWRVEHDIAFRRAVLQLKGRRLACVCKPKPCHVDFIAWWLDLLD